MTDLPVSPAFARNIEPLSEILLPLLDAWPQPAPVVVEVGSGPGQHTCHWAARSRALFYPTEREAAKRDLIAQYVAAAKLDNIRPAQALTLVPSETATLPAPQHADIIVAVNVLHMFGLDCVDAFFRFARGLARPGTLVFVYDTFIYDDVETAPSNIRFDAWLKSVTDGAGGVHPFAAVNRAAQSSGFGTKTPAEVIPRPANNQIVQWTFDDTSTGSATPL